MLSPYYFWVNKIQEYNTRIRIRVDLDRLVCPFFGMCIWHRMGINLPGVMPEGLSWYLEFEMILIFNRGNYQNP